MASAANPGRHSRRSHQATPRAYVGRTFALEKRSASNDFEVFLTTYGGRMAELDRQVFTYLYFLTTLRGLVHQRKKFNPTAVFRMRQAVVCRLAGKLSREVSRTLLAES